LASFVVINIIYRIIKDSCQALVFSFFWVGPALKLFTPEKNFLAIDKGPLISYIELGPIEHILVRCLTMGSGVKDISPGRPVNNCRWASSLLDPNEKDYESI